MTKIHIDEVHPKGSLFIVNFQNGYTTNEFTSKECSLYENPTTGVKTFKTKISGLTYAGTENKEELGKTLVLARNKKTGKVRLIEVANVELKPQFKNNEDNNKPLDTSFVGLSRQFGSKKLKKIVELREKYKVNVETVTKQMHNVTVNITEEQLDLTSYSGVNTDNFYIPPINRDALKPQDVYEIYHILSKEQYEIIYSEMQNQDYMGFVLPWIKDMIGGRNLSVELKVLAVYASALFNVFAMLTKDLIKKTYIACPVSTTLNQIIFKNFTTTINGKRTRPLPYKDKAFCYSLVFLLIINNFKCELNELCQNLKYNIRTMTTKLKFIGASISNSGDKKFAELKLPLTISVVSDRRKSAKF